MIEPVTTQYGETYEKEVLYEYLEKNQFKEPFQN